MHSHEASCIAIVQRTCGRHTDVGVDDTARDLRCPRSASGIRRERALGEIRREMQISPIAVSERVTFLAEPDSSKSSHAEDLPMAAAACTEQEPWLRPTVAMILTRDCLRTQGAGP